MQPQRRRGLINKKNWQAIISCSTKPYGVWKEAPLWQEWQKSLCDYFYECVQLNPGVYLWIISCIQTHTPSSLLLCWYSFMYGSDWECYSTCPHYQWFLLSFAIISNPFCYHLLLPKPSPLPPPTFSWRWFIISPQSKAQGLHEYTQMCTWNDAQLSVSVCDTQAHLLITRTGGKGCAMPSSAVSW